MDDRTDKLPSLIPTARWLYLLLIAKPLACWLGGNAESVEAPNILYFLPGCWLIMPIFYTLLVFGLNYKIWLSSALV